MNEIILNDMFVHVFMLAFAATVLIVFANNYIRYLGQKKQLKILSKEMKTQRILIDHLERTVTWFSKPENTISNCPEGATCETAQNICAMAQATLQRIEKRDD